MKLNKNEAMEIIAKKNNINEVVAVGNLDECWEVVGNVPLFTSANIYRLDQTKFNGNTWNKNEKTYTNEKGEYLYYVLQINGKMYQ